MKIFESLYVLEVGGGTSDGTELDVGGLEGGTREGQVVGVDGSRDLRSISIAVIEAALVGVACFAVELRARDGLSRARSSRVVLATISARRATVGVDEQVRGTSIYLSSEALRGSTDGELDKEPGSAFGGQFWASKKFLLREREERNGAKLSCPVFLPQLRTEGLALIQKHERRGGVLQRGDQKTRTLHSWGYFP